MNTTAIKNIIKTISRAIGNGEPKELKNLSHKASTGYLRSLIHEAAYVYLNEAFPNDEDARRAKLSAINAALHDAPFIILYKNRIAQATAPFVSFYGTLEELEELKAQEYDLSTTKDKEDA